MRGHRHLTRYWITHFVCLFYNEPYNNNGQTINNKNEYSIPNGDR